ncbi:GNAT family N-acetyltransferase [Halobacillus yeomjeoni]|uniref:GNAT family N-acetyltransferase n=1 Tax=Halobacillus yeomjeoni TaxID=311194 RepID=A0A931HU18_9BACI|nr:GNAT family N-acetyltransferase [Halobacillus yeomjeoni]MBH0229211.1 GNAT family N-acetyltransferase [Halobacillus yeomjeoni]
MLEFHTIDLKRDRDRILQFRRSSFIESFRDCSSFDKNEYLTWIAGKVREFPDGFVVVWDQKQSVGQVECSIRMYEGERIGYVHLFYLISEKRSMGLGARMHEYALHFFQKHHVEEFHLRVSPTNKSALEFYKKIQMKYCGSELDGKVIRMKGKV